MKQGIKFYCETCKKKLTERTLQKHNNENHNIRCMGFMIIGDTVMDYSDYVKGVVDTRQVRTGIALNNAKAGERVMVRLG